MKRRLLAGLVSMAIVIGGTTGCGGHYKDGAMNSKCLTYATNGIEIEQPEVNTEEYEKEAENKFIKTDKNAISTFSADVDTASYSNIRRMINDDYRLEDIPKNAVRIEEMLNYFSYDFKEPKDSEPFAVDMQIAECPWNEKNNILKIGLNTKKIDFSKAPDSNLVFLLDVSGSMNDANKLPLLIRSFSMLTEELSEKDTVSVVTYAGDDRVVLQGAKGNKKEEIIHALESLESEIGGCTNGSAGIQTAYELAEQYYIEGGNNRVILATDGDLNVGITDNDELEELITKKKESGVFLTTLGFGMGNYKDNKMEMLADKGNGNYAYIDSTKEAKKVMVTELGANMVTVAKDVKLQVEFDKDVVGEYRLIGYENRMLSNEDFNDDTKDAGDIGAGHSVTALYELKLNKSAEESTKDEWLKLGIRYKQPESDKSKKLSYSAGKNNYSEEASSDMNWALSVAEFGLLLGQSEYAGKASYDNVLELAKKNDVSDDEYKTEYIKLVKKIMD